LQYLIEYSSFYNYHSLLRANFRFYLLLTICQYSNQSIFKLAYLIFQKLVEVRGLEPLTSGLQSPRSAKLSYTPLDADRCLGLQAGNSSFIDACHSPADHIFK
jgi:hypothetical protein